MSVVGLVAIALAIVYAGHLVRDELRVLLPFVRRLVHVVDAEHLASVTGRAGVVVGASSAANVSVNLWPNGNVECGHYGSGSFTSLATVAGPDRVAFERAQGGTIYLRPDTTHVLARESWPFPSPALVDLVSVPADWVEITA